MIIVLKTKTLDKDVQSIEQKLGLLGMKVHISKGEFRTIVGVIGDDNKVNLEQIKSLPYVENVFQVLKPYRLVSREFREENTVIKVGAAAIGGKDFVVMAGPCAVENEKQLLSVAREVKKHGAMILRASAFKPRTSPYDFQGLKDEGLRILRKVKQKTGIIVETEVMDVRDVPKVAEYVDILRVGARNMHNFDLLKEVGKIRKPVILKRGIAATIKEFLLAAEYIVAEGNPNVILCERGIRTFETATRFTLDISAIPVIKQESHLPIIVDPSHPAGNRNYVIALARAAVAAGADGIIVEVHPEPEKALSDGIQSLTFPQYEEMMSQLKKLALAMGRTL
ncbi:MAG: 3-deoxy-7-phosphoheptulonate synthase [Candidatus Omnitrophica bacterium]|nr:3-deoxy-7-phosphoheptulonate synthase [Candidatus Omnitrophota bacterium]